MRVFARWAGRAPAAAAAGLLLLSLLAHLAVLRSASLSSWFAAQAPPAPVVAVSLVSAPATAPALAQPAPPVRSSRRDLAVRRRSAPRQIAPARPAAAASAVAPTSAQRFDAFGAAIDAGEPGQAAADGIAEREAQSAPADSPEAARAGSAEAADTDALEAAPAPASEPPIVVTPQAGSVRYRVHFGDPEAGNVVAMLEHSFDIGSDRYRLHSEGRAQGLVAWFYRGALVQDSVGRVSQAGLAPTQYREQRGDRAPRAASIDAARGEVVFASGARAQAPAGVQDRLSALVQLALLRQSRPALFATGATIELPMLGNSSIESVGWRVLGPEPVRTDSGVVETLRLSRAVTDGREAAIDVWLALDARVVPVRLRITEPNGRALDQVIASH